MAKFPVDAPKGRVLKALERLGFRASWAFATAMDRVERRFDVAA